MVRIHLPPPANLARTLRQGWYGDDKPNLQQPLGAISSAFPEIAQMRDRADRNRPLCDLRPQDACSGALEMLNPQMAGWGLYELTRRQLQAAEERRKPHPPQNRIRPRLHGMAGRAGESEANRGPRPLASHPAGYRVTQCCN
jgi:hypothetical protein